MCDECKIDIPDGQDAWHDPRDFQMESKEPDIDRDFDLCSACLWNRTKGPSWAERFQNGDARHLLTACHHPALSKPRSAFYKARELDAKNLLASTLGNSEAQPHPAAAPILSLLDSLHGPQYPATDEQWGEARPVWDGSPQPRHQLLQREAPFLH